MLKILLLIKIIIYDKFPETCSIMLTCFLLVEGIVCYMSEFPAVL